mgnify:CR=1 FL=1
MRGVTEGLLMVFVLSSFVFAASSEIVTEFSVQVPEKPVVNYVSPESSIGDYVNYFVVAFIALLLIYFIVKEKKVSGKKRVSSKRVRKKK